MFNMTIQELYDLLKIKYCELQIKFDYPSPGELTLTWVNKYNKQYSRRFSAFEVETIRVPEGMLLYAKRQAEECIQ